MERHEMILRRIAGIGFRNSAGTESILDALARAGAADLRDLALPEVKLRHPAVTELARLGYDLHPVSAATLTLPVTLTESAASRMAHGTGSVSEACALAVLGPEARLTGPRVISADGRATAATATVQMNAQKGSDP